MPTFHENWYSDDQCQLLVKTAASIKDLSGVNIEIGCWEGKSTTHLANALYPQELVCCDTWQGNIAEYEHHATVQILKTRDVFRVFVTNMKEITQGNYSIVRDDCLKWLKTFNQPVKFCHIDASHDYDSVKKTIELLLPKLVPGGILCGDDFLNSKGVERAVRELLPAVHHTINFWQWQKPTE